MALDDVVSKRAHYSPPWADVCIIGIAGSSGSGMLHLVSLNVVDSWIFLIGKSTLSHAIVSRLNLPWVVILSMVCCMFRARYILPWLIHALGFFLQILG